jgi:hypothetical protein
MSQATLPSGPYRNSNLFSGYYLDERVYDLDAWDCDAEAREAFETIRDIYETEKSALDSYDESPLREHWIDEVLAVLGHETLSETPILDARGSIDRTLYGTDDERLNAAVMKADEEYAGMYGQSLSILEAKQWDADFTERFSERRSYRDASHQIKFYLEHTPESVSWGILTNGRKWRLYGTKDYETETYYEVDLPELLESGSIENFKRFYVFFRAAAFRESGGTTFLDTVWSESETAAQELGEDLQDNVFTALRVLGEGFVETNGLEIDPADDERLAELKEQSLVLLYRLMFVLYAESRGLIDPDDPHAATEYEENFSLSQLRREVIEEVGETPDERAFEREFSEYSTSMWDQLRTSFRSSIPGMRIWEFRRTTVDCSTRRATNFSPSARSRTAISRRWSTDFRPPKPTRDTWPPTTPTSIPGISGRFTRDCSNTSSPSHPKHRPPSLGTVDRSGSPPRR